jgi:hypothetical protein
MMMMMMNATNTALSRGITALSSVPAPIQARPSRNRLPMARAPAALMVLASS